MPTSLQDKLWLSAQAFIPFQTLLSAVPFGWYDSQLPQDVPMGCIVVQKISAPKLYSFIARVNLCRYRIQFKIWASSRDQAEQIENGLACFLDQTSFTGVAGLQQNPNQIDNATGALEFETEPPKYIDIVDAFIWNNDST